MKPILLASFSVIILLCACNNTPAPRVSPMATAEQSIGDLTQAKFTYSRPGVKGRIIWGDLVKYGSVWRTGANEATVFEINGDVSIEGKALPAGKYALFTIPGESSWTIIFNSVAGQWGAYDYDESKDVLRVTVTPRTIAPAEWLTIRFDELAAGEATALISWADREAGFRISAAKNADEVRPSPSARVSQRIAESVTTTVDYSRPGVKGRTIWGDLVKYGSVWRTGANENTIIEFDGDVLVEGKALSKGKYGLHTIPGADSWVIVFNKTSDAWGSYDYKESDDALRVIVKPKHAEAAQEWLQIAFEDFKLDDSQVPRGTSVVIRWADVAVPFTISLPGM